MTTGLAELLEPSGPDPEPVAPVSIPGQRDPDWRRTPEASRAAALPDPLRTPIAAFRAPLIGLCTVLASLPGSDHRALLPLAALGVASWLTFRLPLSTRTRVWSACGEALVCGLGIAVTGGSGSPLLPFLLSPGLSLGLLAGPWIVGRGGAISVAGLGAGFLLAGAPEQLWDFTVGTGEWVLLQVAIGVVASWALSLARPEEPDAAGYAEAHALLAQLHRVARGLPVGLDAGTAAQSLLDDISRQVPSMRSGVLVQTAAGGALVPMAVRGVRRVPWRTPLSEAGPLREAWQSGRPVIDRRRPDIAGRRNGGAVVVAPLTGTAGTFGLVVLESGAPDAFTDSEVAVLAAAARRMSMRLETSLLFDEVRSVATAEERTRLAREMHDGVAQDLAFLGYRLDALRARADRGDPDLPAEIGQLRSDLTQLISNLRLSITDLRTSLTSDRGLGAALSSYIRAVGAGRQLTVHLSLQESPFRLPADREVALFRVAQAVAQDVREAGQARNIWMNLVVEPPSARLLLEYDGTEPGAPHDLSSVTEVVRSLGGDVRLAVRPGGGARIEAGFEGGEHVDPRPAGR